MKHPPILSIILASLILWLACCSPTVSPPPATLAPTPVPPTVEPTFTTAPTPEPTAVPTVEPTATAAPKIVLEVAGPGGQVALTMDDLKKLPLTEGQAGIKSSTGKITVPELFQGVTLEELSKLAGGLDASLGVNVVAEDGYAMTLSYNQIVNGDFIAYDPSTGEEKKIEDKLQVMVAYGRDGQPLDEKSEGTLRLVIISAKNNQVTDGHWSVKWVNKIEVKPLGAEWNLTMKGVVDDVVDRNTFQSCTAPGCHQATWTDDKAQKWVGVPLWLLAGRVDDAIKHDGPAFFEALADAGYTIEVVAADGYKVSFDSVRVKRNNNILLAYQVNDNPLPDKYFPLRLVGGDLQKNEMAGAIQEIDLIIDPVKIPTAQPTAVPQPEPTVEVTGDLIIVGLLQTPQGYKEADLRAMNPAKITAEHPKQGKQDYEGVRITTLLMMAGLKPEAKCLVIIAVDGYSIELPLSDIQACSDCLVSFTEKSGKFAMVMPGMQSSFWVKDVVKLEIIP